MRTAGIICEYNPLHLGHKKQMDLLRSRFGEDCAIVCLMSGNYVQRGAPAIVDKMLRAKAAIFSGADLVLELPVTYALSSAEGFARGGVEILGTVCDHLCFGAETADCDALMATARALLSEDFPPLLRTHLETGKSFPAARAAALEQMGIDSSLVESPNNILAVEYCKAILETGCTMQPLPIHREGSYHDKLPDKENPSATAVRKLMLNRPPLGWGWHGESRDWGRKSKLSLPQSASLTAPSSEGASGAANHPAIPECWKVYVPTLAQPIFENAPLHTLSAGENAILMKLRTMTDAEFEELPYGSEGLWRKFMHACRSCATLEEIIAATKSKRYTRTRIDRMVMCAFLGITKDMLEEKAPYVRCLALNNRGRSVWKQMKQHMPCINAGETVDHPYWQLEKRCGDLYGLFCTAGPEAPGREEKSRIFYQP